MVSGWERGLSFPRGRSLVRLGELFGLKALRREVMAEVDDEDAELGSEAASWKKKYEELEKDFLVLARRLAKLENGR